jgi:PPK2 family polyphosphate:nucleotide phosphotransferase
MAKSKQADLRASLRVAAGTGIDLAAFDPTATFGRSKADAEAITAAGLTTLTSLQDRLWAEAKHRVLIVLQGIDAAGKDGTIKHVMSAFNPQGCYVHSFKVPTPVELAHDYLWRAHAATPGSGEIAIFNRSHYEDVLVVRVHDIVPREIWSRRYRQINEWERMLAEEGTTIVKFFLVIDRDEQRKRLEERLANPAKRWKFRLSDLDERKLWDRYVAAFEEAISRCSTEWAPWYVIPANRNWFRNLAVAEILGNVLTDLHPAYPPEEQLPASLVIE